MTRLHAFLLLAGICVAAMGAAYWQVWNAAQDAAERQALEDYKEGAQDASDALGDLPDDAADGLRNLPF